MRVPKSLLFLLLVATPAFAREPLVPMPWPQHYMPLTIEGRKVSMAYMDVAPAHPNGQSMLLLHGKNFNGWYWKGVMTWALQQGYRVVVPDQLGFGNSDYPDVHYSFHMLAENTHKLLDTLGITRAIVIGHSMGGMLATRFALMYPRQVDRLVLEDPIGLEDYRTFVPYASIDLQHLWESNATFQYYQMYQKSYFPQWKPEYDSLVIIQALQLPARDFKSTVARANALTYDMVYQQPVCYEFSHVTVPTLLIVGSEDRTIVGKGLLSEDEKKRHGQYHKLARKAVKSMPDGRMRELKGVGHIPHIQEPDAFFKLVGSFLEGR